MGIINNIDVQRRGQHSIPYCLILYSLEKNKADIAHVMALLCVCSWYNAFVVKNGNLRGFSVVVVGGVCCFSPVRFILYVLCREFKVQRHAAC